MKTNATHTYVYETGGRRAQVRNVPVLQIGGERRLPAAVFRKVQRAVKGALDKLKEGETHTLNYEELT